METRYGLAVWMLAGVVLVFGGTTNAVSMKSRLQRVSNETSGANQVHSFPTIARDGGGSVCFPAIGCGYERSSVEGLKGGPGPLCWPDYPCAVAVKDGPGPMCFPGIGCAPRAKDGGGPMCFPGYPCIPN